MRETFDEFLIWTSIHKSFPQHLKLYKCTNNRIGILRSLLFWDVTQRRFVVGYGRFGGNLSFPSSTVKMAQIDCPETSVINYQCTLRNVQEDRGSHLHRVGCLKSLWWHFIIIIIIIIIIIFLHGLSCLTCSGIDALPSFPGASTISSSARFLVEGVFRKSGVVHSFKMFDPVLFVFGSHVLYSRKREVRLRETNWFCGWPVTIPRKN